MELYENIRARRVALNMTQQELAKKTGYKSVSTIAKIKSGKDLHMIINIESRPVE